KSSILTACYFPTIDLNTGNYELDLTDFETCYIISNVNSSNNKPSDDLTRIEDKLNQLCESVTVIKMLRPEKQMRKS
ncbi:hypothetical protein ALC56_05911, partial [Trachymyrmex septentrionalis]